MDRWVDVGQEQNPFDGIKSIYWNQEINHVLVGPWGVATDEYIRVLKITNAPINCNALLGQERNLAMVANNPFDLGVKGNQNPKLLRNNPVSLDNADIRPE
jgi:hypothetical protein